MNNATPPHVVALDDDPALRELVSSYLEDNELRVTAVSNGHQLMEVFQRETIDLVVLDLGLPGEDGMTIARTLREQSTIPIIMLTGRGGRGRPCHGPGTRGRRLSDQAL